MRKYSKNQNLDDLGLDLNLPEELDEEAISKLYVRWALKPLEWMHYFFPHHFSLKSAQYHGEIADNFLLLPHKIQAYEAPRGSAKTTVLEFLTLHASLFNRLLFIMFISLTEEIASQRIVTIRHECEHNKLLRLFFGDLRTEKWGEKEIIIQNEKMGIHTKIMARGLGQQVLGIKYLYKRPQLIVVDDPEDVKTAENVKNVDKDERWFTKEVEPSVDKEIGKIVMVSTPVTSDCLIERVKKYPKIHFKRFAILTEQGLPLWSEWMDRKAIQELKAELTARGQLSHFYTEYLCDPLDPEKHPFTEDMMHYLEKRPENIEKWLEDKHLFILVDLAVGEKKRNAYSALVVIAVDPKDMWTFVDEYQVKTDWEAFAKDLYGFRDKWNKIQDIGVEEAGQQKGFWSVLQLVAEKYGYKPIYAVSVRPEKDKNARTERLLPRFKYGKAQFFPHVRKTPEQLILHPDGDSDLRDCAAYGEIICYGPGMDKKADDPQPSWATKRAATDEEMEKEYRERQQEKREMEECWDLDSELED